MSGCSCQFKATWFAVIYANEPHHVLIKRNNLSGPTRLCYKPVQQQMNPWTPPEHSTAYSGMSQGLPQTQSYEIPRRLLDSDLEQWFSAGGVSGPTLFPLS